ncbi:MAG TPA: hypothetical protein VN642_10305 [Dongiaceae bacterium]|nr:hypothetical protein [Dongiaceae bacterium]
MSRKPIDQQQPSECRQAVWDLIRKLNHPFTTSDLQYYIYLDASSINDYLIGLTNAWYLKAAKGPKRMDPVVYTLINDTGHDAPRVRKDGTPVTMGQGRLQMWNAMRILKTFSATDLAFNASTDDHHVAASEAKTYCEALCRAGYLVGRANQRYMLIPAKWTGPQPPQIQRTKQVYDPNLKKVVWSKIEGGAE